MSAKHKNIANELAEKCKTECWGDFKNDCYSYLAGAYPKMTIEDAYEIVKYAANEHFREIAQGIMNGEITF